MKKGFKTHLINIFKSRCEEFFCFRKAREGNRSHSYLSDESRPKVEDPRFRKESGQQSGGEKLSQPEGIRPISADLGVAPPQSIQRIHFRRRSWIQPKLASIAIEHISKVGFTLIEVVLYAGMVTGFITISLLSMQAIIEYGDRLEQQRELNENQRFLIEKLQWILSGVQLVTVPAVGGTNTSLSVTKINFAQNPLMVTLAQGVVSLGIGGGNALPLTNRFASTSGLKFEQLALGNQRAIRVSALLENTNATTSLNALIFIK
ncbi:MAG: hypothetical protein Q8R26_00325 [bacterium]|nr:hypothetical protein [bacterium]